METEEDADEELERGVVVATALLTPFFESSCSIGAVVISVHCC